MSREAKKDDAPAPGSTAVKISASIGLIAAMVLATVVNLYVARHYKRWDVTRGGLYTLSNATLETLHGLEEPVTVHVLLSASNPLALSAQHLLEAYKAESPRLVVKLTDPDTRRAEFLAIQQKYGVQVGQMEDGRVVTDAAIIVARNDKPYFITESDLVAVEDEDDPRVRPRLEEALTTAIRSVTSGERPRMCFSTGHGERPLDEGGDAGLAALKERLSKNNYDVTLIAPARAGEREELPGCDLLVIAGPTQSVPPEDSARFAGFVKAGGNALLAVNAELDDRRDAVDLGLGDLLAALGLKLDRDLVFERDPKRHDPQGVGEVFSPEPRPHALTSGLMKAEDRGVRVTMKLGSSLSKLPSSEAAVSPLYVTTDQAFGMVGFAAWAKDPVEPKPAEADLKGPLTVAWAVEMPKPTGAQRGARAVVIGSSSLLLSANWQQADGAGNRVFIENAISWLVSRPALVSIPKKPAVAAGLRLSAEDVTRLGLYSVLCMPAATVLFGVAVFLRRRGGERRGKKSPAASDGGALPPDKVTERRAPARANKKREKPAKKRDEGAS